jgi:hypothetical protein
MSSRPLTRTGPAPVARADSSYRDFYAQVAAAQLADWMPEQSCRVLDLSGAPHRFARQLADAGHDVVQVCERGPRPPWAPAGGRVHAVRADASSLGWLQDASVDAVLAESRVLSLCLAAELTVEDLFRVLRPGGRLLLVVESLVMGLARLADQGRWAELADVPAADVVLVPGDGGQVSRCFWPEELSALLADAGFDVDWVRPRSVLSVATVERAVAQGGPAALRTLVATEVALAAEREGQSTGLHLVASARRP